MKPSLDVRLRRIGVEWGVKRAWKHLKTVKKRCKRVTLGPAKLRPGPLKFVAELCLEMAELLSPVRPSGDATRNDAVKTGCDAGAKPLPPPDQTGSTQPPGGPSDADQREKKEVKQVHPIHN
jgi:hypothetical protein